jgi:N-acetylglucosamine kinase-like BadF-type ATPase
MRYLLAIDAGGTKCETLFVGEDGALIGQGRAVLPGLGGRHPRSVMQAVRQAMPAAPTDCTELHVAAIGEFMPATVLDAAQPYRSVAHNVHEEDSAFCQADVRHGLVVLSGTGAFVFARLPNGRKVQLDALGPLLGDHGGGYQIGLAAMRAVMQHDWHPRHQTSLLEPVLTALGMFSLRHMIGLNDLQVPRDRVAQLAAVVDAAARAGDAIARRILEAAAADLAETFRDMVDKLGIARDELAVIGTGGVLVRSAIYREQFLSLARTIAPGYTFRMLDLPPVTGTALVGLQRMGIADERAARTRLLADVTDSGMAPKA